MSELLRVLVVEDNTLDARHVQRCLRDPARWSVHVASTMAAATSSLASGSYDIILLDMHLPDAGPHDTVTRILPAAGDVPVLVLTGLADPVKGLKAIEQGAADWMCKDEIEPQRLKQAIYAILAG